MMQSSPPALDPAPLEDDTPITTLANLGVMLTLKQVAKIYLVSVATMYRDLALGTFRPAPFRRNPYRWRRVDIERDLEQRTAYAAAPRRAPKSRRVSTARRPRAKK